MCAPCSGRRGGRAWSLLAALITVVVLLVTACSSPEPPTPAGPATAGASTGPGKAFIPPDTPAGAQLGWLVEAMDHLPMSDADVRAHFDAGYLAMVGPAALNQWLQAFSEWLQAGTGAKLVSIKVDEPSMVAAVVSGGGAGPRARVGLTVGSRGLIGDLDISPAIAGPVPATWAGVDATLRSVAPKVRLLVADVSNGSCQPMHSIDPDTPEPFGSVLKLYVLHALGDAVASGKVSWERPLTVNAQLKSLPSGVLQNEPDGTQISVLDAATKMIAISDNTATDMLINLVGRSAVEAALTETGMANPALNRPFLTTRETFHPHARAMAGAREALPRRERSWPAGAVGRHSRPATPARRVGRESVEHAKRYGRPRVVRLGQRHLPCLRLPDHPHPPTGSVPDRPSAFAQRRHTRARPGPVGDNLAQGRSRARHPGPGLPGHDPDGADLCRDRVRPKPRPAPRPCHGGPRNARGDEGGVHTSGAALKSGFQTSQRSCASVSHPASRPMKSRLTRHFGTS
jgi:Beta-lactamase enzyme family/ORF 12 gene product N-terminal